MAPALDDVKLKELRALREARGSVLTASLSLTQYRHTHGGSDRHQYPDVVLTDFFTLNKVLRWQSK